MKTITLQIDNRTAAALEGLGLTRGISPESLGSAMLINSTIQSVEQGPGEVVECYLEHGLEIETSGPDSAEWEHSYYTKALARLGELKRVVKRIKCRMREGGRK